MKKCEDYVGKKCEVSIYDRRLQSSLHIDLSILDTYKTDIDTYIVVSPSDLSCDAFMIGTWDIFDISEKIEVNEMGKHFQDVMTRVAKGAKWLDKKHPGWQKEVDISKFDITRGDTCIIGQVLGDFATVYSNYCKSEDWVISHGFDYDPKWEEIDGDEASDYSMLQETWFWYLTNV